MMLKMDKIRNAANSYYLLNTMTDDEGEEFEYVERFQLNWDLYKGEKLSDEAKGEFHL